MRWFALRPQRTTLAGGRQSSAPHRDWATPHLKGSPCYRVGQPEVTRSTGAIFRIGAAMASEEQIQWFAWRIQGPPYADMPAICDSDHFSQRQRLLRIVSEQTGTLSRRTNEHTISEST